jgi:hypothetical protein
MLSQNSTVTAAARPCDALAEVASMHLQFVEKIAALNHLTTLWAKDWQCLQDEVCGHHDRQRHYAVALRGRR